MMPTEITNKKSKQEIEDLVREGDSHFDNQCYERAYGCYMQAEYLLWSEKVDMGNSEYKWLIAIKREKAFNMASDKCGLPFN